MKPSETRSVSEVLNRRKSRERRKLEVKFAETLAARSPALRTRMHTVDLRLSDWLPNAPPKDDSDMMPVYCRAELAPLFALSALRHVAIHGRCVVPLDNAALAAVARAWSRATRLKFEPAHRSKEAAAVLWRLQRDHPEWASATLAGLLHIAERCRELRVLALMLDLATLPSTVELRRALEPLNAQPCPLRKLSVGWSPIGDHMRLTSALSAWFPALVVIKAPQACANARGRWQQVAALVPRFARVRAQERAWRAAQEAAGVWEHAGAPGAKGIPDQLSRLRL